MTRLLAQGAELWSAGAGPANHVTEGPRGGPCENGRVLALGRRGAAILG